MNLLFYSKIRVAYHFNDDGLHKNGMGSAGLAQLQQYNDLYCDEGVDQLEQPSSTMEIDRTAIEENVVANLVVSEETGEEEQQGLQDGVNSAAGVDIDISNDDNIAYDDPLDMEPVDYMQELHETVEETENTHETDISNSSNVMNSEEKQKELESGDGKQDSEQLESTQSSQPVSLSSSSYNPSPIAHRKSTRVSVHRELDVNYEQSTTDNSSVRILLHHLTP